MKKHLTPVARKFGLMGLDVRTKEQKAEDERRDAEYRGWTIRQVASRYDREKIYEEIWSEPIQRVAKKIRHIRRWVGKGLQEAKYSTARTRLLGHEGGRQAYSKTTSTSGIVHVKADTLVCVDVSRLGISDKVSEQFAVEFMTL